MASNSTRSQGNGTVSGPVASSGPQASSVVTTSQGSETGSGASHPPSTSNNNTAPFNNSQLPRIGSSPSVSQSSPLRSHQPSLTSGQRASFSTGTPARTTNGGTSTPTQSHSHSSSFYRRTTGAANTNSGPITGSSGTSTQPSAASHLSTQSNTSSAQAGQNGFYSGIFGAPQQSGNRTLTNAGNSSNSTAASGSSTPQQHPQHGSGQSFNLFSNPNATLQTGRSGVNNSGSSTNAPTSNVAGYDHQAHDTSIRIAPFRYRTPQQTAGPLNNTSGDHGSNQVMGNSSPFPRPSTFGSPARAATHGSLSGTSTGGYGTPLPWWAPHNSSSGTHVTQGYGWSLADPAGWSGWPSSPRACSGFEENQMVSFTWTISDAQLLRDEVEDSPLPSEGGRSVSAGAGKSEVWTTQPLFGDGKWKLELVRTSRATEEDEKEKWEKGEKGQERDEADEVDRSEPSEPQNRSLTVLSIFLTSAQLEYAQADVEIPASVMFGIKPARTQVGQDQKRAGPWLWQHHEHFIFKREDEFLECHSLPSLSDLLENEAIAKQDAFSITVQIGTGPGAAPFGPGLGPMQKADIMDGRAGNLPFVARDKQLVPKSLIDGLENMIDCSGTGDVVLIVRERGVVRPSALSSISNVQDRGTEKGLAGEDYRREVIPIPLGMPMYEWALPSGDSEVEDQDRPEILVRDRVLWAHSSILSSRSEFFRDMLGSNFIEGQSQDVDGNASMGTASEVQFGRRVKALRLPDADYTAAYWLLRYLYLEEVEFIEHEDVRITLDEDWMGLEGADSALLPKEISRLPNWEWKSADGTDREANLRIERGTQAGGAAGEQGLAPNSYPGYGNLPRSVSTRTSHASIASLGSPTSGQSEIPTTSNGGSRRSHSSHEGSVYPRRPGEWDPRSRNHAPPYQVDSKAVQHALTSQQHDSTPSLGDVLRSDPHSHPSASASPASALGLYRLAHRYGQTGLSTLAKAHLIASLTPSTAFPILLATHLYQDLHEPVKAYVLEHWDAVSVTYEFDRCCDEVSAGEWGLDAGRALRLFMRSLVSPSRSRR